MDFNTDLGQATKLGARLTVLAMAVALAACGGDGASDAVSSSGVRQNTPSEKIPRISQNSLSLSMSSNNIEGWEYDGVRSTLTMRVADKFGNAVPAGSVVNFTAEGGQINSKCTIANVDGFSQCSVAFESQQFRPVDGRVTILATVEGEKSYIDNNKNNMFDAGDTLDQNIGDTFRDDNENGMYDAGEYIPLTRTGATGACSGDLSVAMQPNIPNTCSTTLDGLLRVQVVLLLAGSTANIEEIGRTVSNLSRLQVSISSRPFNLPMPSGTGISATVIKGTTDSKCEIINQSGESTIPSIIATRFIATNDNKTPDLSTTHGFSLKDCTAGVPGVPGVPGDSVAVKAVTPKGSSTEVVFPLR